MTYFEQQLRDRLILLERGGGYIALQLRPGLGMTTIDKASTNRCFINEGRKGEFKDISERFFDTMVELYDTRNTTGV